MKLKTVHKIARLVSKYLLRNHFVRVGDKIWYYRGVINGLPGPKNYTLTVCCSYDDLVEAAGGNRNEEKTYE